MSEPYAQNPRLEAERLVSVAMQSGYRVLSPDPDQVGTLRFGKTQRDAETNRVVQTVLLFAPPNAVRREPEFQGASITVQKYFAATDPDLLDREAPAVVKSDLVQLFSNLARPDPMSVSPLYRTCRDCGLRLASYRKVEEGVYTCPTPQNCPNSPQKNTP